MKEQVQFSTAKLTLAVLTAPRQAFEEVIERKMLRNAIIITLVAGFSAMLFKLAGYIMGQNSIYELGINNPITNLALVLGTALGVQILSRMTGGKGTLRDTLTGLGWAQVVNVLASVLGVVALFVPSLMPVSGFAGLWLIVVCVFAVERAQVFPVWKAALLSIMGGFLLFGMRLSADMAAKSANPDLMKYSMAAGTTPIGDPVYLVGVAVIAAASLFLLLKQMERALKQRILFSAAMLASVCSVAVIGWLVSTYLNPIGYLRSAVSAYNSTRYPSEYAKAQQGFTSALSIFPADYKVRVYLGHSYLMLKNYDEAERVFSDVIEPKLQPGPMTQDRVRALVGLGAVEYFRNDYKDALARFDEALKLWPNYREAHSRKALTLARMGKLKEAQKAAEQAIAHGADSQIPQLVLIQVYSANGDKKKAEDIFFSKIGKRELAENNPAYVGSLLTDSGHRWDKAADYVGTRHLKYPVDTEPIHILATEKKNGSKR